MKNDIVNYLNELIPNPKCELNYNKDYELLIAVMLSAQTTDKRVNFVTNVLFDKYPNLDSLAKANLLELKDIIRSIGTFNKKSKNIIDIANSLLVYGYVPNDRSFLESLSGVGRKTTNVVLSELYKVPCIAVDTHVKRVSIRLGLADKSDDVLKIEKKLTRQFKNYDLCKLHHQMVLFGRYYCKASKPICTECGLKNICKKTSFI